MIRSARRWTSWLRRSARSRLASSSWCFLSWLPVLGEGRVRPALLLQVRAEPSLPHTDLGQLLPKPAQRLLAVQKT
ncbi:MULTISPECIES: hypothetical protein [unclassified Streptomyces]|uniref:hypothetical protein n=1 Tax=Streptomyces sp. NPDC127532 TaxID=3345399 RepID=UPI0036344CE3